MSENRHNFPLPAPLADLVRARDELKRHYGHTGLSFTFDGNLMGDLGEAIAVDLFGIELQKAGRRGIDGTAPDGSTVQVKVSGTGRGPAYRTTGAEPDCLLFFLLDLNKLQGEVAYNGPLDGVRHLLPTPDQGQRILSLKRVREADAKVLLGHRIPMLSV